MSGEILHLSKITDEVIPSLTKPLQISPKKKHQEFL